MFRNAIRLALAPLGAAGRQRRNRPGLGEVLGVELPPDAEAQGVQAQALAHGGQELGKEHTGCCYTRSSPQRITRHSVWCTGHTEPQAVCRHSQPSPKPAGSLLASQPAAGALNNSWVRCSQTPGARARCDGTCPACCRSVGPPKPAYLGSQGTTEPDASSSASQAGWALTRCSPRPGRSRSLPYRDTHPP